MFRGVSDIVNSLENDTKVAEEALLRIKDIVIGKEKVFDKWQKDLELIEQELIQLDKILFNV